MDAELVEALKIVLNAIAETQAHLKAGYHGKAHAELTDPLLQKAIEEVQAHLDEAV
jgi:hypothetical protein